MYYSMWDLKSERLSVAGVAVAQWLALRLQCFAAILVTSIALLAVLDQEGFLPQISAERKQ